ncbi:MAG: glucose 1-dehydrogenase [Phycisphaeraceae bacterium]
MRTVAITGAVKGIGRATAEQFAQTGAQVALLDVDAAGEALAEQLGERALFVDCDVSNEAAVERAVRRTVDHFGGIDVLVNNAGIQRYSSVTETSEQEWDRVMGVNLKGAFLCAKHAIPSMLERGGGVVINVSSVQAFLSQPRVAPYTTSKTALLGLTRSIAVDYAPTVRCVAVCPGTVDTPMLREAVKESSDPEAVLAECRQMHLLQRVAQPEEVAELIVFLASERAPFITGQAIRIDGGLGVSIGGSKRD